MKFKYLKSLKLDVSGDTMSRFKFSRFSKNIKSDLFFSLKKEVRNKKISKKNLIFKVKNLLGKVTFGPINSNKRDLDFNSMNSKNVFLRTKRKSSFGQTLLEKQRLKRFLPRCNERNIKKNLFETKKNKNNKYVLAKRLWDNIPFVFSSSKIFDSKEHVYNKSVYGEFFYRNLQHSIYSYRTEIDESKQKSMAKVKLCLIKNGKGNLRVFDRILPNNIIQDLRLNKIKILSDDSYSTSKKLLPFSFDIKKVVQHYRLKRG